MLNILDGTSSRQKYVGKEMDDDMLVLKDPKRVRAGRNGEGQRKKTVEMNRALHAMGIKPAAFMALHNADKPEEVRELLEESLVLRTADIQHRPVLGNHSALTDKEKRNNPMTITKAARNENRQQKRGTLKAYQREALGFKGGETMSQSDIDKFAERYDPHIDVNADLPTVHEAYQFLMKTFVDEILKGKEIQKMLDDVATTIVTNLEDMDDEFFFDDIIADGSDENDDKTPPPEVEIESPEEQQQQEQDGPSEVDEQKIKAIMDDLDNTSIGGATKKKTKDKAASSKTGKQSSSSSKSKKKGSSGGTRSGSRSRKGSNEMLAATPGSGASENQDPLKLADFLSPDSALDPLSSSSKGKGRNQKQNQRKEEGGGRRKSISTVAMLPSALGKRRGSFY